MTRNATIISLSVVLVILMATAAAHAQTADYFPGMLVVKYEKNAVINDIRSKQGIDPMENVRRFLTTFGAMEAKPLFPRDMTVSLQNRTGMSGTRAADPAAELRRIHTVRYAADVDPAYLAAKLSRLPGIEYAEPKYIRYLQEVPNDTVQNSYESFHNFYEAWDVTQGSSDVVIAIVDAGVAHDHPELDGKLWSNPGEIAGNGVDDDANGKIDDTMGWDFWSAGYTEETFEEDNDPYMDANDHGTHVAGIAAAETNNDSTGIAGAGYNVRYMPIKVGGITDNPNTSINEENTIGFGMEGIVYAAANGADVINCSWGGGGQSQAEQDVINFANEMGALVVAAAGNQGIEFVLYPAAYENTLSVGSVETNNRNAVYSNFGYPLDVLATGSNINSIRCIDPFNMGPNCELVIGPKTGTSMATPVVSGLAGLIRSHRPGWSAQRIATQIRATATTIDNQNSSSQRNKLGKGKIDAEAAVSMNKPGIRLLEYTFVNNEDDKLGIDEPGNIRVTLTNFGASTSGLSLNPISLRGPGIDFPGAGLQGLQIATGDTVEFLIPIEITGDYDFARLPEIKLGFSDSGNEYSDFDVLPYEEILFDNMDENRVKMSVSANGAIGFSDAFTREGGIGFIPREQNGNEYADGDNLLFEGGLIMQMNGRIYDAVREGGLDLSRDFNPQTTFRLQPSVGGGYLTGTTSFSTDSMESLGARIRLTAYAIDDPDLSNVVFLRYDIENFYSFFKLKNLYLGLFNDWDIGENAGANNSIYSQQDSILYVMDNDAGSTQPIVAVSHLGALSSAFAIDNASQDDFGPEFGIYDGYSDSEKETSLKAGTAYTTVSNSDVSTVMASGPYNVNPRATATVGFVYAFGADPDELRSQILAARERAPFEVSDRGEVYSSEQPGVTKVFQNYPNPFNPTTRIRLDLSEPSDVNISVYNVLGRKVAEIVDGQLEASIHVFDFNASSLSSGIYFARLKTNSRTETIKMVLVK